MMSPHDERDLFAFLRTLNAVHGSKKGMDYTNVIRNNLFQLVDSLSNIRQIGGLKFERKVTSGNACYSVFIEPVTNSSPSINELRDFRKQTFIKMLAAAAGLDENLSHLNGISAYLDAHKDEKFNSVLIELFEAREAILSGTFTSREAIAAFSDFSTSHLAWRFDSVKTLSALMVPGGNEFVEVWKNADHFSTMLNVLSIPYSTKSVTVKMNRLLAAARTAHVLVGQEKFLKNNIKSMQPVMAHYIFQLCKNINELAQDAMNERSDTVREIEDEEEKSNCLRVAQSEVDACKEPVMGLVEIFKNNSMGDYLTELNTVYMNKVDSKSAEEQDLVTPIIEKFRAENPEFDHIKIGPRILKRFYRFDFEAGKTYVVNEPVSLVNTLAWLGSDGTAKVALLAMLCNMEKRHASIAVDSELHRRKKPASIPSKSEMRLIQKLYTAISNEKVGITDASSQTRDKDATTFKVKFQGIPDDVDANTDTLAADQVDKKHHHKHHHKHHKKDKKEKSNHKSDKNVDLTGNEASALQEFGTFRPEAPGADTPHGKVYPSFSTSKMPKK